MSKLKPCPFCGESEQLIFIQDGQLYILDNKLSVDFYVQCLKCGARGGISLGVSGAAKMWNSRAGAEMSEELKLSEMDILEMDAEWHAFWFSITPEEVEWFSGVVEMLEN